MLMFEAIFNAVTTSAARSRTGSNAVNLTESPPFPLAYLTIEFFCRIHVAQSPHRLKQPDLS